MWPTSTSPTLVIHRDSDRIVPIAAAGQRTAKLIKGVTLSVVKDGPHAVIWTHTDPVNSEQVNFLAKSGGGPVGAAHQKEANRLKYIPLLFNRGAVPVGRYPRCNAWIRKAHRCPQSEKPVQARRAGIRAEKSYNITKGIGGITAGNCLFVLLSKISL